MLVKRVCKKCQQKQRQKWGELDEASWKGENACETKEVYCFQGEFRGFIPIEDNPPEHCPYALEHFMGAKK